MKCSQVIQILEQQSPKRYACGWDNVGLLVGDNEKEIKKIYVALDATDAAIQEAVQAGADMLLTHHPLIFGGLKQVVAQDYIGRRVIAMVRADLCYYAMHTNFDVMGMAQLAEKRLCLCDAQPLEVTAVEDGVAQGIGRVGSFADTVSLAQCCDFVKKAFDLSHVKVFGSLAHPVRRAAVCPGSGKSDFDKAVQAGADVYITGDIDHHTGLDAVACGMAVIDAGHYGLEHIFTAYMQQYLQEQIPDIEVTAQGKAEPFIIV